MSTLSNIRGEIHLPTGMAAWVICAHILTLLSPLLLVLAVVHHWEFVQSKTFAPSLFYIAVGLMMASSAFEIAQNTIDKWYLTQECASANGTSLCDFLFYAFLVAAMGLIAIACFGQFWWIWAIGLGALVAFCWLYLTDKTPFPALGVAGLLSTASLYFAFGDPLVFLQIVASQLTLLFFAALLATGAQWLHGFTTGANAVGIVFVAWAVHNSAMGTPKSWPFAIVTGLVLGGGVLVLRPFMLKAQKTPEL